MLKIKKKFSRLELLQMTCGSSRPYNIILRSLNTSKSNEFASGLMFSIEFDWFGNRTHTKFGPERGVSTDLRKSVNFSESLRNH